MTPPRAPAFRAANRDVDWDALRPFATPTEQRVIDVMLSVGGDVRAAARILGRSKDGLSVSLGVLKRRAVMQGHMPEWGLPHPLPDPLVLKGMSVMVDGEGRPKGTTWLKADVRQEAYNEHVKNAILEFIAEQPKLDAPPAPVDYSTDVIPWLQIGDAHLGMLAQAAEVGHDFDLKIGERELCAAIARLIDEMPRCERAVLNDLGDFTHYENFKAETEGSGHILDYDSRFPKMIRSYVRIMRFLVEKMLTKAAVLDVIINQGNHSRTNDIWMGEMLRALYPSGRVNVLDNRSVFIAYRMGNTLVMVHHGDKCKPIHLSQVLTRDFKADYGETEYHYIDTGHIHHRLVAQEIDGIMVESWNTLAPPDRWAHDAGYRAAKSISVVLRSRTYGEVGRRILSLREVRDALYGAGNHTPAKQAFTA